MDRANIVQDMLQLYKDKGVAEGLLNVNFCNEPALDMDGVKREAFTLFWEKVMRYILMAQQLMCLAFPHR